MLLQIESLQAQLEEKTSLANDQINSLLEDRRVQMEEFEAYREREYQKINNLTEQLNKSQALLYESTKDFLGLKYDSRLKERKWMNERDSIMREMDYLKEQIDLNKADLELQVFINCSTINFVLIRYERMQNIFRCWTPFLSFQLKETCLKLITETLD